VISLREQFVAEAEREVVVEAEAQNQDMLAATQHAFAEVNALATEDEKLKAGLTKALALAEGYQGLVKKESEE
jgi:hypothetical protein